ncbi:MAG: hypothetical protein E7Z65_07955 [Thermoplasmata archaeon]|nr:hypothetical protein [Thermoplasmata archaeon]
MQTYLIEKTENSVKLGFKEANLTLITPLMKALNENPDVVLVRYIDKHPELQDRVLYVETKKGDAMKAIEDAAKSISDYYTVN